LNNYKRNQIKMAFVYKAERNIKFSETEDGKNVNLGPGSYI